jgi:hemerythrin-like domain-containing protein
MPVSLGSKGQAGFDQPLELMKDCHRRIESFLGVLIRVVERASDGRLDEEGRRALEEALKYFREAAPRHTADEEESLFPRLREKGVAAEALKRVEALEADHVKATGLHDAVEATGLEWLQGGSLRAEAREKLRAQLEELRGLYQGHIRVEDEEIFPLAGKALSAEEVRAIGEEMRQRRGRGECGAAGEGLPK